MYGGIFNSKKLSSIESLQFKRKVITLISEPCTAYGLEPDPILDGEWGETRKSLCFPSEILA